MLKKSKFNNFKRDKNGNLIFPIHINETLTIVSIGRVSNLPAYNTKFNIYPIGYKSIRIYPSTKDHTQKVKYYCEVLEGKDKPIF